MTTKGILAETNKTLDLAEKMMARQHKYSKIWQRQKARIQWAALKASVANEPEDMEDSWADAAQEDEICQEEPTYGQDLNGIMRKRSVTPL